MKYLIIIASFVPMSGYSYFQELYNGYQESKEVALRKTNTELSKISLEIQEYKYDWNLSFNLSDSDSFNESLYSFNSQRTKSKIAQVGLTKNSYLWGKFDFNYQETQYDLSHWRSSSLANFSSEEIFESKYIFSYEYEVLNKDLSYTFEAIQLDKEIANLNEVVLSEEQLYQFFQTYLLVKMQVVNRKIYQENYKLSQSRYNNIKRRVRDGLSKKIDLYQAEATLIDQKTQLESVEFSLDESIKKLETIMGEKIPTNALKDLDWPKAINFNPPQKVDYKKLRLVELKNKKLNYEYKIENESSSHRLAIGGSYSKNSFDEQRSFSREDLNENDFEDKKMYLNYIIPLGNKKQNLLEIKHKLTTLRASLNKKLEAENLSDRLSFLKTNINRKEIFVSNAIKKEQLYKKTTKEGAKLFKRGQRSLDETLRLEESLAAASIDKYQKIYDLELLYAEIAYLSGDIQGFLAKYKD